MSKLRIEKLPYKDGTVTLEAHVAIPQDISGRLPTVLINHAFAGQGDFERSKAERIAAALGYVGIALDNYGKGVLGNSVAENSALMTPFLRDRAMLRSRLLAGLAAARQHPAVDGSRMGAIGFCFGGLCALDLARSGAELRGVCAFHALFSPPEGIEIGPIRAKVLALHGHDDPMATPAQVLAFEREMTQHGVDWQVHVYGGTVHAFTNPNANDHRPGTVYSPAADRRSWSAMSAFFEEVFA